MSRVSFHCMYLVEPEKQRNKALLWRRELCCMRFCLNALPYKYKQAQPDFNNQVGPVLSNYSQFKAS